MKSIPAIHLAITENTENVLVKCAPQRLIIGKPISQIRFVLNYVLSVIHKQQHEKHLCNLSSHYGKYTRETRPHISIRESHNTSI